MSEEAQEIGAAEVVPAPERPSVKRDPRRAGSKGGKSMRHVALIGLGANLPAISLKSHGDRLRLLEAVAEAIAHGRTSALVAQTLLAAVREARAESLSELEALVQRQAREIDRLRGGA